MLLVSGTRANGIDTELRSKTVDMCADIYVYNGGYRKGAVQEYFHHIEL